MADLIQFITKGKLTLPAKTVLVGNVPIVQPENTITISHDLPGTDYDAFITPLLGIKTTSVTIPAAETGGTEPPTASTVTVALPYIYIKTINSENFTVTYSSHYNNSVLKWRVFE